jgi:hypothetical protein
MREASRAEVGGTGSAIFNLLAKKPLAYWFLTPNEASYSIVNGRIRAMADRV